MNWHDYYNNIPKDSFRDFLDEFNEALENHEFELAERLQADAKTAGVWVDSSGCFRHPDDPHKQHALDEVLADDWIPY